MDKSSIGLIINKLLLVLIGLSVIIGGSYFYWLKMKPNDQPIPVAQISNFEECAAEYPVTGSNPRQCKTPDGKSFTENIGNAGAMKNLIVVDSPQPNDAVKSPLVITGKARGVWYFEASFPIKIVDANNNEIGTVAAKTTSDWMTEDFVPFTATLEFNVPSTGTGNLILKNDNPSGMPQNDKQLTIPVKF
jgi:hypothetical protein